MSRSRRIAVTCTALSVLPLLSACEAVLGLGDKTDLPSDAGSLADVQRPADVRTRDAKAEVGTLDATEAQAPESSVPVDAGPVCTDDGTGYSKLTDVNCWTSFDTSTGTLNGTSGAAGGTFDGRYVYLASIPVMQLDTSAKGGFTDPGSWKSYNPLAGFSACAGALFDGRYAYFIAIDASTIVRYDTHGSFTSPSAWTTLTLTSPNAVLYSGGTFDGTYLYLAPNRLPAAGGASGWVARFDTRGDFTDQATAWSYFDTSTLAGAPNGFVGAVFDGRYVSFPPKNEFMNSNPVTATYDTTADFTDATSWGSLDLTTVDEDAADGFVTGAFDGTNVYLTSLDSTGVFLAAPASLDLDTTNDWGSYSQSVGKKAVSWDDTAFDGRFLYYVPGFGADQLFGAAVLVRYDTKAGAFGSFSAYSTFDTSTLPGAPENFAAAVFDGQYLYLAELDDTVVLRFTVKQVNAMPSLPAFHGSFY